MIDPADIFRKALERINSIWSGGALAWAEHKCPELITELETAETELNITWVAVLAGGSAKDFRDAVGSYTTVAWRIAKRHRERDR